MSIESWRTVWRDGFAKVLPIRGLEALRDALIADDQRLTQGSTTTPPGLHCVQDWPVEAADAISFTGWQGLPNCTTVGEVSEHFAKMCFEADRLIGEPAACRWFLNWYDDTPRDEMRRELLEEVNLVLKERQPMSEQKPESVSATIRKFTERLHRINERKETELNKLAEYPETFDIMQAFADEMGGCLAYLCNYTSARGGNGKDYPIVEVIGELQKHMEAAFLKLTGREYVSETIRTSAFSQAGGPTDAR